MNLHEYQAKNLLSDFNVPIQRGRWLITDDVIKNSESLSKQVRHGMLLKLKYTLEVEEKEEELS